MLLLLLLVSLFHYTSEALATFENEKQFSPGAENKKQILPFYRKLIPPRKMKLNGKGNGAPHSSALMGLTTPVGLRF